MERKQLAVLLLSFMLLSCGTDKKVTSSEAPQESLSTGDSLAKKTLYFPIDVDEPGLNTGVDAFIGYDDYRITHMYVGEGEEEEILSYTYNEKYCTIDKLGRIHAIAEGSALCGAVTKSGKYPIRVNVKKGESFRNWIRQSAAEMQQKYVERGSKKNSYVFMGDSFFDPRGFWEEGKFYNTFSGQNVFLTGIGTAKTNDWMTIKKENLIDYSPKALFVNLGVNSLINAGDNGKTLGAKLCTLFDELHYMKEDMPIYYYGIIKSGEQSWNSQSEISNSIMKEYAKTHTWFTYLDIPSLVNNNISAYLKNDNLHPNDAAYEIYARLAKEHM